MRTVRFSQTVQFYAPQTTQETADNNQILSEKAKKVYGLVQFFTVQAKKQASCDNQAIFPYYTPAYL